MNAPDTETVKYQAELHQNVADALSKLSDVAALADPANGNNMDHLYRAMAEVTAAHRVYTDACTR